MVISSSPASSVDPALSILLASTTLLLGGGLTSGAGSSSDTTLVDVTDCAPGDFC